MTQKDITEKVTLFQQLLGLTHYKIEIEFTRDSEEINGSAAVEIMRDYRRATIYFASDEYKGWTEEEAQETVCHELMHIVTNPMKSIAVRTAKEGLGKPAKKVVRAWITVEDEAAVQLLTDAFLQALRA